MQIYTPKKVKQKTVNYRQKGQQKKRKIIRNKWYLTLLLQGVEI